MAVGRVTRYAGTEDEEDDPFATLLGPQGIAAGSEIDPDAEAPSESGIPPIFEPGPPIDLGNGPGLGSTETPRDRVRTGPTDPSFGGRRPSPATRATPSRPTTPSPIAGKPPNPALGANPPGGGTGFPAVTAPAQVARQPLILGGGSRSMLGSGDTFSGGFGARDQRRSAPKSIIDTLLRMFQ